MIPRIARAGLLFLLPAIALAQEAWPEPAGLEGLLVPNEKIEVASPVQGVVMEILVERGIPVKEGQILARLQDEIEEATIQRTAAALEFNERKLARNQKLYDKSLIAPHEIDQLRTEAKLTELELNEARVKREIKRIKSPIDGIVLERLVGPGEFVGSNPLLVLVKIDPLFIEVSAPAAHFGAIKVGDMAKIRIEGAIKQVQQAAVKVIDPVINPTSATFGIRLEMANPGNRIPAGLKCLVELPGLAPATPAKPPAGG